MYNKSIDMGASGTCALAFVVGPDYLVLGNAGDCRAMLIDASTRECNWITTPHTPYEREEFNRVVTLVQGRDSMPIRPCSADLVLAMSRKIGTKWFDNYALERILSDSTKISQTFDTYNDSLALLEPVFLL
jgi:serine/threonine protein phosphatase PrpC